VATPANVIKRSEYATEDNIKDLYFAANFVHLAHGYGGYTVVNVLNKDNPTRAAYYDTPGNALGVTVYNDVTYVADRLSVLLMFFQDFSPGDCNADGSVNGADVTFLVRYLKGIGPAPDPLLRGDCNGDCLVGTADVTYLVRYLKGIGPAPVRGDC